MATTTRSVMGATRYHFYVTTSSTDLSLSASRPTRTNKADAERLARAIVEQLDERQAEAIVLLDVGPHTDLADFFVIASATSRRQFGALEDALRHVPDADFPRREGGSEGGWLLCDYGSVVVHIFDRETREYYDLDGLWLQADTLLRVE
ncbi:MAG: ribosome silencing factor [Chloroflexi bacterium]|nr:ribosome silencing factor [Chloroflexota bacterium]MYD16443.1 ribosome silencing factor [Chloroflexota bacterium]